MTDGTLGPLSHEAKHAPTSSLVSAYFAFAKRCCSGGGVGDRRRWWRLYRSSSPRGAEGIRPGAVSRDMFGLGLVC